MSRRMEKLLQRTNEMDLQYTEGLITEDECLMAMLEAVTLTIADARASYTTQIEHLQEGLKNLGGTIL